MTPASEDLSAVPDEDLIDRYEAIRVPRTPASERLRREIERRTAGGRIVRGSRWQYRPNDDDDSVIREEVMDREQIRVHNAEMARLTYLQQSLGRQALDGAARPISRRRSTAREEKSHTGP